MDRPNAVPLAEDRVAELRARWTPEATAAAVAFLESRPVAYDLPTVEHGGTTYLDLRGLRIEQTQIDKAYLRNVNLRWAVFRDVGFKNARFAGCNLSQVSFIDCDQAGFPPGKHFRETGNAQPLGRDEEELQVAVKIIDAGLARCRAVAAGMDALDGETAFFELDHLIFHQRDQRADHQRGAAAHNAGELIAQRLAGAGGHD